MSYRHPRATGTLGLEDAGRVKGTSSCSFPDKGHHRMGLDKDTECRRMRRISPRAHLMLYPFCQRNPPAPARLNTAHGRSSSMTDHTQRQPMGGACFMMAM
jgi:hypothetical protein